MAGPAASIFEQLGAELKVRGKELVAEIKGVILFDIEGDCWTLDLREGNGKLTNAKPESKADLELKSKASDFVQLVMGKIGPQQAFILGKLRIKGSMAMALKLQPILSAAKPKAKL
ncbi:hypothetical protein BSKO_11606 [Bryopsis sp. KO-2023]|nr:hypothetical protein BSKO_11606 [Bryopsis sp. KO-2023]